MNLAYIAWAGIKRNKTRTLLTLVSATMAFALVGALKGVDSGFDTVVQSSHADRLLVEGRSSNGAPLPASVSEKIRSMPEVRAIAGQSIFVGAFQAPQNQVVALAVHPDEWFSVYPEVTLPSEQLRELKATRNAIVVSAALFKKLGLKIGDSVPLQSPFFQKSGNPVWTFRLVGVLGSADPANVSPEAAALEFGLINYVFFDESRAAMSGTVNRIIVSVSNPKRSATVASAIDEAFRNSPNETRTRSEQEQAQFQLQQLGDIQGITRAVSVCVLIALLFVTANAIVQSVRERINEFAVLLALGFRDRTVFALVLLESSIICALAAGLGLVLCSLLLPRVKEFVSFAHMNVSVTVFSLTIALLVALLSAAIPAIRVARLPIARTISRQ